MVLCLLTDVGDLLLLDIPTGHLQPLPKLHGRRPARSARLQGMLKDSQLANGRLQKEYSLLVEKVAKLQGTLEEHVHTNTQVRRPRRSRGSFDGRGMGCRPQLAGVFFKPK